MQTKVFWCKVNKYYTDKWMNTSYLKDKKWIFIATCVVTDKAKRKWLKYVRDEAKKLNPWEMLFLSGCGSIKDWEVQKDFFEIYPELNEIKDKIELLPEDTTSKEKESLNEKLKNAAKLNLTTKKFVLIQSGCDSFCSFCLTVKKRGKHFSRSKEEIISEIGEFEKSGGKEIVLTWVNLCAWWLETTNDIGQSRFAELLEEILEKTQIERIRISSLWPEFVDDKVIKVLSNSRIMPHFHFSVQSGANATLKHMGRHYSWDYMRELLGKIRNIKRDDNVEIGIWADIIVGFPNESDEDFEDTLALVKDYKITKVHWFPFSPHKFGEDVPAGIFPNQIDEKVKKERLNKLLSLAEEVRNDFISSQAWIILEALIEAPRNWNFGWWTSNYIEINKDNFEVLEWEIKKNSIVKWKLK